MKGLLWLVIGVVLLVGLLFPLGYLYIGSKLPPLDSEFELSRQLEDSIEGERISARAAQAAPEGAVLDFVRPDLAHYPPDLVALYLSEQECPRFLTDAREEGFAWAWRLVASTMESYAPGDGRCEREFALRIAHALGVSGSLELAVAANKLHKLLRKDQLVAYDLASQTFERGVVGLDEVTTSLFGMPPDKLTFAETAELMLALPPWFLFDDLKICRNPVALRQSRDAVIVGAASTGLFPEAKIRAAQSEPRIHCAK